MQPKRDGFEAELASSIVRQFIQDKLGVIFGLAEQLPTRHAYLSKSPFSVEVANGFNKGQAILLEVFACSIQRLQRAQFRLNG